MGIEAFVNRPDGEWGIKRFTQRQKGRREKEGR
jgi:hypothetical protein